MFGRVKQVSRVLARLASLAQIGELARRVVLSICFNQLSQVYLLAFKCSCCNKDFQIPKRVCVVV